MSNTFITGLYGCSCHPFSSWSECDKAHKQKLPITTKVTNRHTLRTGNVCEIHDGHFVSVKYGKNKSDQVLEHVAQLIKHETK